MRLELKTRTDLAKRAMEELAADGDLLKRPELARRVGTTAHYLPHVMRPLVARGWIKSVTGPHGGYRLDEAALGISMLELIEAVEGPVIDGRCVLRGAPCPPIEPCALHDTWSRAREAMIDRLGSVPVIADAGRGPRSRRKTE